MRFFSTDPTWQRNAGDKPVSIPAATPDESASVSTGCSAFLTILRM
ncbi:uncharacterized protein FFE2_08654 [Fusarium fujikuroi]|nr:uncharacterized protein FFE2_08654 [Fusarium fujikuroi]